MAAINVLVLSWLEQGQLNEISSVSPRIQVTDAPELLYSELQRTREWSPWVNPVWRKGPEPEKARELLDELLRETEVLLCTSIPPNLMSRAPKLKWMQIMASGFDRVPANMLQSQIIVTNSAGMARIPIGEDVLMFMLMFAKQAPRLCSNKQNKRWEQFVATELYGKTLGIVGLGNIGNEIARLAKCFNMEVLASRKSATSRQKNTAGVDEIFPPDQLRQMLHQCDFVVLVTPLTPETRGLIGEAELKAMKPEAYIINVARGPIIKEMALVRALKEGWIAGAALDVFETEPLPQNSELWEMPNVIISPHMAAGTEQYVPRAVTLFCENLRRYVVGEKLSGVVGVAGK